MKVNKKKLIFLKKILLNLDEMKEVKEILIEERRKEKGFSQKQLGEAVGVKQSAVCQWETGKCFPKRTQMQKLTEVLDLTLEELIEEKIRNAVLKAKKEQV